MYQNGAYDAVDISNVIVEKSQNVKNVYKFNIPAYKESFNDFVDVYVYLSLDKDINNTYTIKSFNKTDANIINSNYYIDMILEYSNMYMWIQYKIGDEYTEISDCLTINNEYEELEVPQISNITYFENENPEITIDNQMCKYGITIEWDSVGDGAYALYLNAVDDSNTSKLFYNFSYKNEDNGKFTLNFYPKTTGTFYFWIRGLLSADNMDYLTDFSEVRSITIPE